MRIPTFPVRVVRACWLTPRMRRVTVGGPALSAFATTGLPDERIKLLLPNPGEARPAPPVIDERGFHYEDGVRRPVVRTFTLRRFDPRALEVDIDIVVHPGAAAEWSLRVCGGEEVAIAGPAGGYEPGAAARKHLLAGDETALPSIASSLERLPRTARADVLVELEMPGCELALDSRADVRVRWLHREPGAPAGAQLAEACASSTGATRR